MAPPRQQQGALRQPMLDEEKLDDSEEEQQKQERLPTMREELWIQAKMAVPLAVGHLSNFLLTVISLAYVGHIGTSELAAASLSYTLYNLVAKILLAGMLGGLDTYASQAVGAGNYALLGSMFRQGVLFLYFHTIPLALALASLPSLLTRLGQSVEVIRLLRPYLLGLLPSIFLDAIYRPLNRIMIAQRVTTPTAWVSILAAVQHVPATHLLIKRFGYVGAAYASTWSQLLALVLAAVYVRAIGLHPRVWEIPNGLKLQPWRPYVKISYAACGATALAMASQSLLSVSAGWLPEPSTSLATVGVVVSVYGLVQMSYGAIGQTVGIRVGHGLGAGSAARAVLSARTTASVIPFIWATVATVLTVPRSRGALIGLFLPADADPAIFAHLRVILHIISIQVLLDAFGAVLSGMLAGAGKQAISFLFLASAHWTCALPSALFLAFKLKLGVEGLYFGMFLAPVAIVTGVGLYIFRKVRWEQEAAAAHARMLTAHGGAAAGPSAASMVVEEFLENP